MRECAVRNCARQNDVLVARFCAGSRRRGRSLPVWFRESKEDRFRQSRQPRRRHSTLCNVNYRTPSSPRPFANEETNRRTSYFETTGGSIQWMRCRNRWHLSQIKHCWIHNVKIIIYTDLLNSKIKENVLSEWEKEFYYNSCSLWVSLFNLILLNFD